MQMQTIEYFVIYTTSTSQYTEGRLLWSLGPSTRVAELSRNLTGGRVLGKTFPFVFVAFIYLVV